MHSDVRKGEWARGQGLTVRACVRAKSLQWCPTLCDTMDCSLPGSSASLDFLFLNQSLVMKRTSLLGVSSRGLLGLHRTVQLQLPQHYLSGHSLGLL